MMNSFYLQLGTLTNRVTGLKSHFIESVLRKLLVNEEFSVSLTDRPSILGPIHESACPLLLRALSSLLPSSSRIWFLHDQPHSRNHISNSCETWNLSHLHYPESDKQINDHQLEDPDERATRLNIIHQLSTPHAGDTASLVLLSPHSLLDQIPQKNKGSSSSLELKIGKDLDLKTLELLLHEAQFEKVPQIYGRSQWAQRGGIIDIFTAYSIHPVRLELFDTEIESIREFDIHSQTSRRKLKQLDLMLREPDASAQLADLINEEDVIVSFGEAPHPRAQLHFNYGPKVDHLGVEDYSTACQPSPLPRFSAGDFVMQENQRSLFKNQIKQWHREGYTIYLFFPSDTERNRFSELMGEGFIKQFSIQVHQGKLSDGILIPVAKLALVSSSQLFGQATLSTRHSSTLDHQRRAQAQTDLEDIQPGDLVVHSEYGIGRFKEIAVDSSGLEEVHLRYRDGALLSVPIDQSHLISRYVGMGGKPPQLSKLGDGKWSKAKKIAEKAVLDYAAQLLKVQAERNGRPGQPHPPDGKWMREFETSFPYKETLGQTEAIEDAKADMESNKPMDRLICGDVGFGKTEVAIRAIFKAVTGGKQAAILVPTTVLAEQHWRNFQQRMSHFPIRIDLLNRFRKPSEVRSTLAGLADGSVDIVVGTHRLVSDDVSFKDLGLAVIDEEQRFGVKHKEKFKQRFSQIDVLTLSATPIPRTLYLSLMGARDMSSIDTPPPNKVPVQTSICGYDERIIRDSIQRELKRGGQVFFLHNRVQTIEKIKQSLHKLVPEASIVIGHGQMEKNELELVMGQFVDGKADILLSTTIIESGIDIPNANTIIIDRADRFGLADLYQLRGRVGRGGQKAYAILLTPRDLIQGDAKRRIQAIQQYTALGSGFKIAMRDLEIRGAGNLLGTKQSGHIAAVGFDLYCQLLKQSIDRLKGNTPLQRVEVQLRVDFLTFNEGMESTNSLPCFIPVAYMQEARMRIQAYKRLAAITSIKELKELKKEWKDRYGKIPKPAQYLTEVTALKIAAAQAHISSIEIKSQKLILTRNGQFIQLEGKRFPRLTESDPQKKLTESLHMLRSI